MQAGRSNNFGFIRIACAVPETFPGDCGGNTEKIIALVKKAVEKEARIVVFPELCITGYTCGDLFYQEALISAAYDGLKAVETYLKDNNINILVFVGVPVVNKGRLYNCAVAISNGGISGIIPKSYLPVYGAKNEQRWFTNAGGTGGYVSIFSEQIPFGNDILFKAGKGCIIGAEICEDLASPIPRSSLMSIAGANILVNLSASIAAAGSHEYRRELVRQQSARCIAAYAYSSAAWGESTTDTVFSGAAIISENGRELVCSSGLEDGGKFWVADIDTQWLNNDRLKSNGCFAEVNEIMRGLSEFRIIPVNIQNRVSDTLFRKVERHPFVPVDDAERSKRCKEILSIQEIGLVRRIKHTNTKRLAINISGGLDSTLALLVCIGVIKKLGMKESSIITLSLPGFGTTARTAVNAEKLCKLLGCDYREIDIRRVCDIHLRNIGHDPDNKNTTYENVQARMRTQLLFDISNKEHAIAVGTGDLSELALGWCTYGGDHLSMYNVNSGVPKTVVKHLVRWAADLDGMEHIRPVLLDILDTPVSPELIPPKHDGEISQKTEDIIGPYELNDFFLYHCLRYGAPPEKMHYLACQAFEGKYMSDEIGHWLKLFYIRFFASQFKRSCMPDGPKIGSIGLSPRTDLKMPSDVKPDTWLNSKLWQ